MLTACCRAGAIMAAWLVQGASLAVNGRNVRVSDQPLFGIAINPDQAAVPPSVACVRLWGETL
jgi:hypothetical protein